MDLNNKDFVKKADKTSKEFSDEELKVIKALKNPLWDYRTYGGISKETGLDYLTIKKILNGRRDIIHKSFVSDKNGNDLFTMKDRVNPKIEFINKVRAFISKSIG